MKQGLNKISRTLFSAENRSNMFYVAAFAPFVLIAYSYAAWPFDIMIPLYSFMLLLIKKPKLFSYNRPNDTQKIFGLAAIIASFFLYFALVPLFPDAAFYGVANYAVYILGLFLLFFEVHALREAFTPIFLIVAAVSTSIISDVAEHVFSPYIPNLVYLVVTLIGLLGIKAKASLLSPNYVVIRLYRPSGVFDVGFIWGCVGFASTMLFSIILVVVLFEEEGGTRTKILWAIFGVLGMFLLNILRIITTLLAHYFYGYEVGAQIHYFIGYALFITWTTIFLYVFARSQAKRARGQKAENNSIFLDV